MKTYIRLDAKPMSKNIRNSIKDNIKRLVEQGQLYHAKSLLEEYKKLENDDADIYSIMGIIYMMEGNIKEAEKYLKDGLNKGNANIDLLYNLGYLFEATGRYTEAEATYRLATTYCKENKDLFELRSQISNFIEYTEDKSVILFGQYGSCSKFIEEFESEVSILGYLENGQTDLQIKLKDYKKLDPEKIQEIQYDYIILTDLTEEENNKCYKYLTSLNIKESKIFSILKLNVQIPIEGFNYRLSELIAKDKIELLITGLSYAEVGINTKLLNYESINFALSSQDLYYDYKILEYILEFSNVKNHIKYVLINMAYYSFDFDLSRTFERTRIHRYYPFIEDTHNYKDNIILKLLSRKYSQEGHNKQYMDIFNMKQNVIADASCIEKGEKYAIYHSKMNHKVIREENLAIFDNMLKLLKQRNIEPVIIVCPTSEYYFNNYDKRKIKEFYKNIEPFKNRDQFLLLDYFDSSLFTINDFWDDSHLNGEGAKKLTQLIQKEIQKEIEKNKKIRR